MKKKTTRKKAAKKPPKETRRRTSSVSPDSKAAVDEYMTSLDHPMRPALEALRRTIAEASPTISQGVQWNSPSFRTTEYFATINVHAQDKLRLILHTGAKANKKTAGGLKITDETGLLKWLAKDRCLVTFDSIGDVNAKRAALRVIVREWIEQI